MKELLETLAKNAKVASRKMAIISTREKNGKWGQTLISELFPGVSLEKSSKFKIQNS